MGPGFTRNQARNKQNSIIPQPITAYTLTIQKLALMISIIRTMTN